MKRIPYGYRWLALIFLGDLFGLLWLNAHYPNANIYKITFDYGFEHFYLFVHDFVKFILLGSLISTPLEVLTHPYSRKDANYNRKLIEDVGIGLAVAYMIFCFVVLGKHLIQFRHDYLNGLGKHLLATQIELFTKHAWQDVIHFLLYTILIAALIRLVPPFLNMWLQKLKEDRTYRQIFAEGRGGSSRWASIATYEKFKGRCELNNDKIVLGRALFDDDPERRIISVDDDAHMITIGMTGSGKSTTVLFPNLAMYGGSAIVLDPKGELAKKTYYCRSNEEFLKKQGVSSKVYRHHQNGRCYVLDPFNELENLPKSCYNVLSGIDINSDRVRELLSAISDGCVLPEDPDNLHFEEMAKYFIEGVIAHVLSKYPKEHHNLPFVFDLIHGVDRDLNYVDPTRFQELLYVMLKNDAAGGLPQQVAAKLLDMGDREKGSVLSTVARSLKWVGDPAMRKNLVKSDFHFAWVNDYDRESETKKTTVYIVLPDGLMKEQVRWLRTIISVSLILIKNRNSEPKIPTLFVMDEFPKLGGKIQSVSDGFGILRGYGIKLWAFVQDISQLEKDYPDRWQSMLANSTVQMFGINDMNTAEWASEVLGSSVHRQKEGKFGRKKVRHEAVYPLLTPNELITKLSKTENRQFVKTTEGFPMRLERCAYKPLNIGKHGFSELSLNGLRGCFEDWLH